MYGVYITFQAGRPLGRPLRIAKKHWNFPVLFSLISGFLSSSGPPPREVLSAFAGLTAVFGMGTGSPQLSPLNYVIQASDKSDVMRFRRRTSPQSTQFCVSSLTPSKLVLCLSYPDNCIKMFHTSNELSRIFPLVSESSFSLCICFQIHSLLRFGVSDSHMFVRRLSAPSNMALCLSQVLGLLVPVRSVHRCTSTPGLSTTSSLWDLTY